LIGKDTMDVFEAIKGRRSVRLYEDKKVPDDLITKIIEAAHWSPSATNRQGWKFILIESPDIREKIMKETTAYFVSKAPVWIMVLYSNRTDNIEYKDHLLSAAMAIQNMQLAAYSLGLGSCCVNNLPPKYKLRRILKIPRSYDPVSLVCIGYPKVIPKPLKRKGGIEDIMCRDRFDFDEFESGFDLKLNIKRIIRFIYYRLPAGLKSVLDPVARKFEKRFDK
jgi:nitroreductase